MSPLIFRLTIGKHHWHIVTLVTLVTIHVVCVAMVCTCICCRGCVDQSWCKYILVMAMSLTGFLVPLESLFSFLVFFCACPMVVLFAVQSRVVGDTYATTTSLISC